MVTSSLTDTQGVGKERQRGRRLEWSVMITYLPCLTYNGAGSNCMVWYVRIRTKQEQEEPVCLPGLWTASHNKSWFGRP